MAIDPRVEALVTWIVENVDAESAFMQPAPRWIVDAHALLDQVCAIFEVPQADMSALVKSIAAAVTARERAAEAPKDPG